MGRLATTLSALALLVLTVVALAGPAAAQAEPAPVSGHIDAGFDGYFVPGRAVPVRVELSASRLVSGQLHVRLGQLSSEVVDFEVTAGSTEEHWVLLDGPRGNGIVADATAVTEGRDIGFDPAVLEWDAEVQLVGTLAGLRGAPDQASTVRGVQRIHVVELSPALLDLGAEALAGLDSVAVTEEDLIGLTEGQRDALLGWLAVGGTLYVDGSSAPGLPDAYQPHGGTARSGLATVVATGEQLAAGRWDQAVLPAPNRSIHEDGDAAANVPMSDPSGELFAVDLGRDLPPLSSLLGVLAIYVLAVGPVTYVVLRRRAMMRWVAIPALAVLATGAVYVNGDGLGNDTTAAVIDVIETGPGAAMATSRVVLSTAQSGRELLAPGGWLAQPDESFGGIGEVVQRRTPSGVRLSTPSRAGGVTYVTASGPVEPAGGLEVTARSAADGVVTGQVRNTTAVDLHGVAVFAGRSASASVGTLESGATADFRLEGANQFRFGANPFGEHWPNQPGTLGGVISVGPVTTFAPVPAPAPVIGDGMGEIVSETCDETGCVQCDAEGNCVQSVMVPPGPVECDQFGNCFPVGPGPRDCRIDSSCDTSSLPRPSALNASLWERGTNVMAPGLITAAGWTDELAPVLDLGEGVRVAERRTAVVGRAVPEAVGDQLADAAAVRTLVSVGNGPDGLIELLFRFDLPDAVGDRPVEPGRLRLDLPMMFQRVSVLTSEGEVTVRDDPAVQERQEVALPDRSVIDSHLFVRAALPFAPPQPGRELVVYEAPAP